MSNISSSSSISAFQQSANVGNNVMAERMKLTPEEQKKLNDELWRVLKNDINNIEAIRNVLIRGANPTCRSAEDYDSPHYSPLGYAVHAGKPELVDLFLSLGNTPTQLVDLGPSGSTESDWYLLGWALYYETFKHNTEWQKIVLSLIRHCASSKHLWVANALEENHLSITNIKRSDLSSLLTDIKSDWVGSILLLTLPVAIPYMWLYNKVTCINKKEAGLIETQLKVYQDILAKEVKHEADVKELDAKLTTAIDFGTNLAAEVIKLQALEKKLSSEKQSLEAKLNILKSVSGAATEIQKLEQALKERDDQIADLKIALEAQKNVSKELARQLLSQPIIASSYGTQPKSNKATDPSQTFPLVTPSSTNQQQSRQTAQTAAVLSGNPLGLFNQHATRICPLNSDSGQSMGSNSSGLFASRSCSSSTISVTAPGQRTSEPKGNKESPV